MRYACSADAVRRFDEKAAAAGEVAALIRAAAEGLFRAVPWRAPVAVVTGGGNNGRDGSALAMLLKEAGIAVTVQRAAPLPQGDRYDDAHLTACGIETVTLTAESLTGCETVVDCILGTGFSGALRPAAADAIAAVNDARTRGAYIVSADINSGLTADGGRGERVVRSDLTVAIGAYKPGHFLGSAADVIGSLTLADIGMVCDARIEIPDQKDLSALLPPRLHAANKGSYGTVAILGGCTAYGGAAKLANLSASAMRAGCGIVRLCVPRALTEAVSPFLLESTLCPMEDGGTGYMRYDPCETDRALSGTKAAAVGMGWGSSTENEQILKDILVRYTIPLVLDADGLNALARLGADVLLHTQCRVIVTPHPKEFERISGVPMQTVLKNPVAAAMAFARKYHVIVLLKGTATVVTDGERTMLSPYGAPGMATAGSGDVLSGVLCGMLGYLPPSVETVTLAAAVCGMAGARAQQAYGAYAMTAGDTAAMLPSVMKELETQESTFAD